MSFSHVSRPVRAVTGKTFARKFITLGRVINYWDDAVGPELAAKTYPIGMKVHKAPVKKKEPGRPGKGRDLEKTIISSPAKKNIQTARGPDLRRDDTVILNATLEIAASSADATLIHYQKGLILERLKTLLGSDMITDIKITHAARPLTRTLYPAKGNGGLTNPLKNSLSMDTHIVTDEGLRAALLSMAQSMASPVS